MQIIIRTFIAAVTLTGIAASASTLFSAPIAVAQPKPTSLPIPVCNPGEPTGCGIAR